MSRGGYATQSVGTLIATVLMVAMVLMVAGAVLALAPEQVIPGPGEPDCVQHSLANRGLPPCEGNRPGSVGL